MVILKILIFMVVIALVSYLELKKMKSKDMKKEMTIYSVFIVISASFFIMELMEIEVINPLEGIKVVFEPIGRSVERMLSKGG
ncbi:hypothetical protein [Bacillus pinisoli]|uniref:hypothetical protein n=1 Tax=Bacillus pinisoli TaxID=2901866 RepID=UPI001FF5C5D9|nr:hypothetical protein [Bacillus pinisoli]